MSWKASNEFDESPYRWHVYPLDEEVIHTKDGESCWCHPRIERLPNGSVTVVHFSTDDREYVEDAAKIFANPDKYL